MLEHFFKSPTKLQQLRHRPLSEHFDGLAVKLIRHGYTRASGHRILSMTGKFNDFALSAGIENADNIDEALIDRFLSEELASCGSFREAPTVMRHLLKFLRDTGVVGKAAHKDSFVMILGPYDHHLHNVRGLTLVSCTQYVRYARRFLFWLQNRHGDRPLAELTGVDVLEFITDSANLHPSGSWRNNLCSLTRVFLRYLRWQGIIEVELDRVVPKVPHWHLSSLPRHLPWEQIHELIVSVDTSTPQGLRDKAVLLLIATIGLRNQEVRNLQLGHIAWRTAELRVTESKSRRERSLPLPHDVGEAISNYVRYGRPRLKHPHVFLRHRAPLGPMTSTYDVGKIVSKHLRRAGICAPSYGAHLLRHSLATRMVNQGVPIKEIADVLGHASIDTTAIYTKVNMTNLALVALPFPGGEA